MNPAVKRPLLVDAVEARLDAIQRSEDEHVLSVRSKHAQNVVDAQLNGGRRQQGGGVPRRGRRDVVNVPRRRAVVAHDRRHERVSQEAVLAVPGVELCVERRHVEEPVERALVTGRRRRRTGRVATSMMSGGRRTAARRVTADVGGRSAAVEAR